MSKYNYSYLVLRDSSEKEGHGWFFPEDEVCEGTVIENLYSGDYSLDGYYDTKIFVVERKGSVVEFVGNITQTEKWADFKDELIRLEEFTYPYIICEFPFSQLETYPYGCGLPKKVIDMIKVKPQFIMKRLWEIQLNFKTKILFCDKGGHKAASSLFKRIIEKCPLEQ